MSAVELRDVFRVFSTPEGDAAALQGLTLIAEGAKGRRNQVGTVCISRDDGSAGDLSGPRRQTSA